MPNWCENNLTVTGDIKEVQRFLAVSRTYPEYYTEHRFNKQGHTVGDVHTKGTFCFSGVVPIPLEVLKEDGAWYDWCRTNWGTKWDIGPATKEYPELQIDITDGCLAMSFDTAWSPPLEWMQKASEAFPALLFELHYIEYGCCFEGWATAEDGEISDCCEEISEDALAEFNGDDED